MKIGYIAADIYRHTFEINEVTELLRQHPSARVYSLRRPKGEPFQRQRLSEISAEIVCCHSRSVLRSLAYLAISHPLGLVKAALGLAVGSARNPVYWIKNGAMFFTSLPILEDAKRHRLTHLHGNFGSSPATVAWLGKRILGVGMSMTFHASDIYSNAWSHRDPMKRRKLRDADLVVVVHEDGRRALQRLVPDVDGNKFEVIRICVAFEPEQKPDVMPEPPLVLAAGNLEPKKGFGILIRAVGLLKRRGTPVRVRILGEGKERSALEALIREEAIRDRAEIPGYFQHRTLAEHLAESSVFVVPSLVTPEGQRDGIPTVVVEAWLSRTPVVASLVGGMSEVLINDVTCLVFTPGDAEGLADCIERLLADRRLQEALATEGHHVARDWFSAEKNVLQLLEQIRDRTPAHAV